MPLRPRPLQKDNERFGFLAVVLCVASLLVTTFLLIWQIDAARFHDTSGYGVTTAAITNASN